MSKLRANTVQKYLAFLKVLYKEFSNNRTFDPYELAKTHHIPGTFIASLNKKGICVKAIKGRTTGNYQWVGVRPTVGMVYSIVGQKATPVPIKFKPQNKLVTKITEEAAVKVLLSSKTAKYRIIKTVEQELSL